jgi:hypothetical protein
VAYYCSAAYNRQHAKAIAIAGCEKNATRIEAGRKMVLECFVEAG